MTYFFSFLDKMIQPQNFMPYNSADRRNLMWRRILLFLEKWSYRELSDYKAESLCLFKYFVQEWNLSLYD